ncbi:MAG: creatininase family protein [Promethearchaeota archaeon]
MEISKITRDVFKQTINTKPLVIVPVGSIEQHGPHCPLGTDSLIAEGVAQEACRRTETLCAPTIFIALSEHHKGFPGTLWVSRQTFSNYLVDISKSLVHQGAKKLIFVNGHGGNTAILTDLCSELRAQLNVISLVFQWWTPPMDLQRIFKAEAVHADGVETSMMAAIDSNLLDMKAFEQINPEEIPSVWSRKIGDSTLPLYTHEFSPSGIAGTLDVYSIEKGREVKEAAIKRLSKIIHELLEFEVL